MLEILPVEGNATDITSTLTLIVLIVAGIGLAFDRVRNNKKKNNPNSHGELESIKTAVATEGDKTREAIHRRATEAREGMEQQTRDIVEALKELKRDIVAAVDRIPHRGGE